MTRPSPLRRNFLRLLPGIALLFWAAGPGSALTSIVAVTPDYLRQHTNELSLKVSRRPDGLLAFTIARTVPERRYFRAALVVRREGKTLTETDFRSLGQKDANSFSFALSPETLPESEFRLEETSPARPRGWIGYEFRLRDHVPEELMKP